MLSFLALCILSFAACQHSVSSRCIFDCNDNLLSFIGSTAFQSAARPWWEGPNVCDINEKGTEEPTADSNSRFQLNKWFSSTTNNENHHVFLRNCRDYKMAHVCTTKSYSNGTWTVTTTGRRCCPGFERLQTGYGCQKETPVTSLMDTLNRLNLTILASAFEKSKAHEVFTGKRVTIFAPSNAALTNNSSDSNGIFNVVVFETGDELQPVRDILLNSVVEGELNSWDLVSKGAVKSLRNSGDILIYDADLCCGQEFQVNCAPVKRSDVAFDNGVIHVVDAIVQPAAKTVLDILESTSDYSKLLSLTPAEMKKKLQDPKSHVTVFAFTNKAYDDLPQETKTAIEGGNQCYQKLISNHVLNEAMCKNALEHKGRMGSLLDIFHQVFPADAVSNDAKKMLKIRNTGNGQIMVGNVSIVGDNMVAGNGILYTVSGVLLLPEMQSPLQNLENVAPKMRTMLTDSGLLQSAWNGLYSILLPPSKIVDEIASDRDVKHRQDSLSKYIINKELGHTKSEVVTLSGQTLIYKPVSPSMWIFDRSDIIGKINCVGVHLNKISSCGGTIYQLTSPFPPYEENVMQFLRNNAEFSQFAMLAEAAGFADVLSNSEEAVTVMAFTDEAFDKTFDATAKSEMMKNQSHLKQFVGSHIVKGSYCCSDLMDSRPLSFFDVQGFKTLAGTQKTIIGSNECCLSYGHSNSIKCNLATAKNGVVHQLAKPDVQVSRPFIWNPFSSPFSDTNFFFF